MTPSTDRDIDLHGGRDGADSDMNSSDGSEFSDASDSGESASSSIKAAEIDMFRMNELNDVLTAIEDTVYPTMLDIMNTFEDEPSQATALQPESSANTLIDLPLAGDYTNVGLASLLTKNEPQIYTEEPSEADMSALVNGVMMLMDDAESNDADDDKAFGPSSWTHNVPAQTRDVVNDFSHTDTDVDSFFAFDQASSSSPSSVFVFEATPPQAPYANDRRDPFVDMDVLPKDTLSVTDNLWTTPRQFTPRNLRTMSSREARLAAQASRPGPEDPQLRFSQTDLDMVDHSQNLRGPFREAMKGYRRQLAEAGEEVSDWEDSSIDDAASFDEEFGVPRMVEPLPPREDRMTAPLPRRALREG